MFPHITTFIYHMTNKTAHNTFFISTNKYTLAAVTRSIFQLGGVATWVHACINIGCCNIHIGLASECLQYKSK